MEEADCEKNSFLKADRISDLLSTSERYISIDSLIEISL